MFNHARQGDTEDLEKYLKLGLPRNLSNHKGDSLLMLAAYYGHFDTCKLLIKMGADVNKLNDKQQSILAGVIFKKEDNIVKLLLENGADPKIGTPNAIQTAQMFQRQDLLSLMGVSN